MLDIIKQPTLKNYWRPIRSGADNNPWDFDVSDKEHLRERGLDELDWYDKNGQATDIALIAAGHLRPADKSHPTRYIINIKPDEHTASENENLDRILDHRAASRALILNGGRLGRVDGKFTRSIADSPNFWFK